MSNTLNKIRLASIIEESIVDGPGIRFVIFTQGCKRKCQGCHNPQTLPLNGGYLEDIQGLSNKWKNNPLLKGITISGGEPFLQADKVRIIIDQAIKDHLDILIYSGYYYEELLKLNNQDINYILDNIDYLIDGPFEINKKNLNLLFRGSSNQRYINIKESRKMNKIVTVEEII